MRGPYILTILTLFAFLPSHAQDGRVTYRFTCLQELTGSAEKSIIQEVVSLDPEGRVSLDGQQVKIRVAEQFGEHRALNALQVSGVCDPLLDRVPIAPKSTDAQVYPSILSNDQTTQLSEEELKQAKQVWRVEEPEAYKEYVRALRQQTPIPYE